MCFYYFYSFPYVFEYSISYHRDFLLPRGEVYVFFRFSFCNTSIRNINVFPKDLRVPEEAVSTIIRWTNFLTSLPDLSKSTRTVQWRYKSTQVP